MDLEQSKRMFNDEFRREVMVTGHVTNIRIVNIEVRKMMNFDDLLALSKSQDGY